MFSEVDILLSPTSPTTAPTIVDDRSLFEATRAATRNTYAGAFGNLPGLSVPCGFAPNGLPIGMMLEAAPWQEASLLKAGSLFQARTDWHLHAPSLPVNRTCAPGPPARRRAGAHHPRVVSVVSGGATS